MKIIIDEKAYDYPPDPSYREMRLAKRVTGLLPSQMFEGVGISADGEAVAIDPDAALAFAAIALAHEDENLTAAQIEARLNDLSYGKITFDLEMPDDPPAEAAGAAGDNREPVVKKSPRKRSTRSTK